MEAHQRHSSPSETPLRAATLFRQHGWRYRRPLARIICCAVGSALLIPLQPWPLKVLIDSGLEGRPLPPTLARCMELLHLPTTPGAIALLAGIAGVVLFTAAGVLEVLSTRSWVNQGRHMVYGLAGAVFDRLLRQGPGYHRQHGVGDSLSRVTGDSWGLYYFADSVLVSPARALMTLAVMVWLMSRLDTTLALVALALGPIAAGASLFSGKAVEAAARLRRQLEARMQSHLQQSLSGIAVVQAFTREGWELRRFVSVAEAAASARQRTVLLTSLNQLAAGFATALGAAVILWLGSQHVLAGTLTLGSLLAFVFWFNQLQAPLLALVRVVPEWRNARAHLARLREAVETPLTIPEPAEPRELPPTRGELRFESVTAGYTPGQPVLREIQLTVEPGQCIALVGPSGAGKTTLASLLIRLLDPESGRVLLDGIDVRTVRLADLRARVAMVFQEPWLLAGTAAENIAYGRPGASREEIERAARQAWAHEFIEKLPHGYDTRLGEGAADLSGGQKQRLALARAFLKNAPVLILDEPTSALDAGTEEHVLRAMRELTRGRTSLLIAHRLATVRCADRILVMENGRILESGTHESLLARGGRYAAWHAQRAGGAA